ncbi:hypothetical protein [Pseudomonas sp. EA_65y_Pfl2_P74]|uniref:hypothetical protein n=1 Tax=Pseudomonas sp. EA_65y_Pfl2_P74 TaxID=3088694 RepID=UPI0030DA5B1F
MTKPFDIVLFLSGVLTGSEATRSRHLRQAKAIQVEIVRRWKRENPWTWQRKHLAWFLSRGIGGSAMDTRYYYLLTVRLITLRLGKKWIWH